MAGNEEIGMLVKGTQWQGERNGRGGILGRILGVGDGTILLLKPQSLSSAKSTAQRLPGSVFTGSLQR